MRIVLAIACALLLTGCIGASSTMLSQDTAVVNASGNTIADQEKIVQASIKEAAIVARAHGFQYFVVLKTRDKSSYGSRLVQGDMIGNETDHEKSYGSTNLSSPNMSGNTFSTPDTREQYIRPALEITIRMYRDGEVDPKMQGVWSADAVLGAGAMPKS